MSLLLACAAAAVLAAPPEPEGMYALVGGNAGGSLKGVGAALARAGFAHAAVDIGRGGGHLHGALGRIETFPYGEDEHDERPFLVWSERRVVGPREERIPSPPPALVALLAGKVTANENIEEGSLVDLTPRLAAGGLSWSVPEGVWTLLSFGVVQAKVPRARLSFALGPAIEREERRCPWPEDFGARYRERYGEELACTELAALACDIGARTELVRVRLGALARELGGGGALRNCIDAREPALPFVVPDVGGVVLATWASGAMGAHLGWNVRAAAGIAAAAGKGVCCVLPEEGNWAVTPARVRHHMELAFLWGARSVAWPPFPPDRIAFGADGFAPELPAYHAHLAALTAYAKALARAAALGAPDVCIAVPGEGVLARGTTGLGPAVAAQLAAEGRDAAVTELGALARSPAPPPYACVIVPTENVLSAAHAETLCAWAGRGIAIAFVGAMPSTSPEEGRRSGRLKAAVEALAAHESFFHAATPEDALDRLRTRVPPVLRIASGLAGRIRSRALAAERGARFLLINASDEPWHGEIAIRGAREAAWCDAQELDLPGSRRRAPPSRLEGAELLVELRFAPRGSIVLAADSGETRAVETRTVAIPDPWTCVPWESDGCVQPGRLPVATAEVFRSEAEARARAVPGLAVDFLSGAAWQGPRWRACWITSPEGGLRDGAPGAARVSFHATFHLDRPAAEAVLWAAARQETVVDVNGASVAALEGGTVARADVAAFLKPGKNTIKADVSGPGHLLLEMSVRAADGAERLIATGPEWRASVRRQRWRPAFVLGAADPSLPGPREPWPETSVGLVTLPAGTAGIDAPASWRLLGYAEPEEAAGAPAFPLARPRTALFSFPTGSTEAPVLAMEPVQVALGGPQAPGLENFAGRIRYETTFVLSADDLAGAGAALIDLGEVGFFASVSLNGSPAGRSWSPPHEVWTSAALRAGANTLRVDVATLGAPRRRFAWPASEFTREARAFTIERNPEALCSGLRGPVRVRLFRNEGR